MKKTVGIRQAALTRLSRRVNRPALRGQVKTGSGSKGRFSALLVAASAMLTQTV
jgi:hypothetical protein